MLERNQKQRNLIEIEIADGVQKTLGFVPVSSYWAHFAGLEIEIYPENQG